MGKRSTIDFIATSTGLGQSVDSLSNRVVNCYLQLDGDDAKERKTLYGIPGTETLVDLTTVGATSTDTCRGLYYTSTNRLFSVYAGKLYEIYAGNTATLRATLSIASGPVSIADNGTYMLIADGLSLYRYKLSDNTIATCTLDFNNPSKVVWYNQRFFVSNKDNVNKEKRNYVYYSGLGDDAPLTWEALGFIAAESSADEIVNIKVAQGELWLFGPRSYEVQTKSTNPNEPITFVAGSATEVGCGATESVASINGRCFWLGSSNAGSNQVFVSNGYSIQKISTYAIEWQLSQIADTSDCIGYAYSQLGHEFYVLQFITGNLTLVYDTATGSWHTRSSRNTSTGAFDRWHVLFAVTAFNRVYVGCLRAPKLLKLDPNVYTEYDGREIVRLYQGKVIWKNLNDIFHQVLTINMETGVGKQNGQGYNPLMMMQFSDDGGLTWSSEQYTSIGLIGQYNAVAEYRRLGRSRERVYKLSVSDPVKFVLLGAAIEVEEGLR